MPRILIRAALLALPLLAPAAPAAAQTALLEVRARVSPALAELRALDRVVDGIVTVTVAESPERHRCRLVVEDEVLCRVARFPADARDLQIAIEAPGFRRAVRTAPEVRMERSRLVARFAPIELHPADVTAAPVVVADGDATRRFKLSVTNRSAEPVDVTRVTLDASRPGAICVVEDPVPVFELSATLFVRESGAGRWAVETTARDPENPAERVRVSGQLVEDPCLSHRLSLSLPARISIAPGRQAAIDLVLPARFTVERRSLRGEAAASAPARLHGFDGTVGSFDLYVVTLHTSSRTSPQVVSFARP